jgi:hypothetical protein
MSTPAAWLDYSTWKFGRPMVATDVYDESEWEAFEVGWNASDTAAGQLADVGRRVLYGLSVGDTRPQWFNDRQALQSLVTQPLPSDPPPPSADYTPEQIAAYTAGWTFRSTEIAPIYAVGLDVLNGLNDGRAASADPRWMAERDQLRQALGVS